jgi:hypothetical protein
LSHFSVFFSTLHTNERADLVGGGSAGKIKNIFFILGQESMRWWSFVQAGLG